MLHPLRSSGEIEHLLDTDKRQICQLADSAHELYDGWDVLAPGKKKWRHIDNPLPELKSLQRKIAKRILSSVQLPGDMFGAAPGRDLLDHARMHENSPCVVAVDIRDFFPSTTTDHVLVVFGQTLGMPARWAAPLTKLTTRNHRLPQGAPTSSYLAHLSLLPIRNEIAEICSQVGVTMTAYVDDLVFSGLRARELIEPTVRVLNQYGYRISSRKTRVMGADDTKIVTNLDVTRALRAPRSYVEAVEMDILLCSRDGFVPQSQYRSLLGKVRHINRICAEQAEPLVLLLEQLVVTDSSPGDRVEAKWVRCCGRRTCQWEKQRRYAKRHCARSSS